MLKVQHKKIYKLPLLKYRSIRRAQRIESTEGGRGFKSPLNIKKLSLQKSATVFVTPQEKVQEVLIIKPIQELKNSPRKIEDEEVIRDNKDRGTSTKFSYLHSKLRNSIKQWQPMKILSLYINPEFIKDYRSVNYTNKCKYIPKKRLILNLSKYKAKGCKINKKKDKVSVGIHFTPIQLKNQRKHPFTNTYKLLIKKNNSRTKSRQCNKLETYFIPLLKSIRPKTVDYIKKTPTRLTRNHAKNLTRTPNILNGFTSECEEINDLLDSNMNATMLDARNGSLANKIYFDETYFRISKTFCN